jgi:ATP-binding protein involved in chromosome partitioning
MPGQPYHRLQAPARGSASGRADAEPGPNEQKVRQNMAVTKESVQKYLARVRHPMAGGDLVSVDAVRKVAVCDGYVSVTVAGGGLSDAARQALKAAVVEAVARGAAGDSESVAEVHVDVIDAPPGKTAAAGSGAAPKAPSAPAPPPTQADVAALPGVRHVIAVGAGKGGVGKSTVAVNLAVGLARRGHAVGLMDGDIYGPSLPTMLGLEALEVTTLGQMIQPFLVHGVKSMTIGKMFPSDKPLIWRGPMAHRAFQQLVQQTEWGELDYLIIDLPPGTGDVSLTMAQLLKLTGAVVVCTPQKVAQDDAVRAARMFQQLGIEVLGVVENMSYFVADDITPAREYDIFGRGGAEKMAQRLGVPFLGAIPITTSLRENSDAGNPTANFAPGTRLAQELDRMVASIERQASLAAVRSGTRTPTLSIS